MNEIQKMDALVFVTSEDCMREIATRTDALLAVKQVTNDAEARAADAAVKDAKSTIKAVENERKSFTRKLDEAKKRFMRREAEITAGLANGIERVGKMCAAYLTAKAEAAEAERRAKEEAAKAEAEVTGEAVAVIAPSSNKTIGVKSREYWGFRIVDPLLVPRAYCKPDEVAIGAYKDAARKNGAKVEDLKMDGVEFYREIRV